MGLNTKQMKVKPFKPLGNKVKTKVLKPKTKIEKIDKQIKQLFNLKKPI